MSGCFSSVGGVSLGLVLSSTTDTRIILQDDRFYFEPVDRVSKALKSGAYLIDTFKARADRLKKSVLNAANLHEKEVGKKSVFPRSERWKCAMLTMTYRDDVEYEEGQLTALIKCVRQYLSRKNIQFRYVWVLENTKRGRPHYHLLLWLPPGYSLPKPDKRGWWPHGMTRIEWIRVNGAAYIAKYCAKNSVNSKSNAQGKFPKGARLHGCGGLTKESRLVRRWWNFPAYVRKVFNTPEHDIAPAKGGGFFSRLTGEILPAAFVILSISPLIVVPTG